METKSLRHISNLDFDYILILSGDQLYQMDFSEMWQAHIEKGADISIATIPLEAGFRIIMKDPNVKAILINIFGVIVRCDRVAAGVIEAFNKLGNINIPIIVRLQGTNAVEAKKLIDESGLKVRSAIQLSEAADLVKKAVA